MEPKRYVILNDRDNVAMAIDALSYGEQLEIAERGATVTLRSDISFSHKFALMPVPTGALVLKYGVPIGVASCPIAAGEHVHLHNLKTQMSECTDPDVVWGNRGGGAT